MSFSLVIHLLLLNILQWTAECSASQPDIYTTKYGTQIEKQSLRVRLNDIDESQWPKHLYEVHSYQEHYHLIGPTFIHKIQKKDEICYNFNSEHMSATYLPPMYLNGKLLNNYIFSSCSHISSNVRLLTNKSGKALSVTIGDSILHPLNYYSDHGDSVPMIFTSSTQLRSFDLMNQIKNKKRRQVSDQAFEDHGRLMKAVEVENTKRHTCQTNDTAAVVEIALTFDSSLCNMYGNDYGQSFAVVIDALEMAMIPFHFQTCIRHKLIQVSGYCETANDMYKNVTDAPFTQSIMKELMKVWNDPEFQFAHLIRDFVIFFTGSSNKNTLGGVSNKGSVCNTSQGYAWVNFKSPISTITNTLANGLILKESSHDGDGGRILYEPREPYGVKWFTKSTLQDLTDFINGPGEQCLFDGARRVRRTQIVLDHNLTCEAAFNLSDHALNIPYFELSPGQKPPAGRPMVLGWMDLKLARIVKIWGNQSLTIHGKIWQGERNFTLHVEIKGPFKILEYYRVATMFHRVRMTKIWSPRISLPYKLGTKVIVSRWSWGDVNRPNHFDTCCNRDMYLFFYARICKTVPHQCIWRYFKFVLGNIQCGDG